VTRRVLAGGLLLAVAVVAAVVVNALRGPRQDGPLQLPPGTQFTVRTALPDGEVLIWGMDLPWDPSNRVPGDIRIESIETVGVRGVEVLGLVLNNAVLRPDGICLSYGVRPAATFPPPDVPIRDVKGAVLPAEDKRPCVNHPSVLVGVRRSPESALGVIEALRMLYEHQGTAYELVLPFTLEVRRPGADTN
jgi:hypothetical protein